MYIMKHQKYVPILVMHIALLSISVYVTTGFHCVVITIVMEINSVDSF